MSVSLALYGAQTPQHLQLKQKAIFGRRNRELNGRGSQLSSTFWLKAHHPKQGCRCTYTCVVL